MTSAKLSENQRAERLNAIRNRYGEILSLDQVAEFYRYPSIPSVRKAHQRGTLPVALHRFPGKAGFFAKATDVAESVDLMVCVHSNPSQSKNSQNRGESGV
jgi:hypothetical protein